MGSSLFLNKVSDLINFSVGVFTYRIIAHSTTCFNDIFGTIWSVLNNFLLFFRSYHFSLSNFLVLFLRKYWILYDFYWHVNLHEERFSSLKIPLIQQFGSHSSSSGFFLSSVPRDLCFTTRVGPLCYWLFGVRAFLCVMKTRLIRSTDVTWIYLTLGKHSKK